ncbi:MAG TPA: hypothetical protein VD863_10755 [Bradyrhizobium sp.]|nr:hypothetical protein [Bradyrhizobium sp.]
MEMNRVAAGRIVTFIGAKVNDICRADLIGFDGAPNTDGSERHGEKPLSGLIGRLDSEVTGAGAVAAATV